MTRDFYKQRGSTVIGFIAGLIVGLLIAVIIAMIVTKTAIPFSQKHAKQGKIAEPVSVATPSADPNRPLYASASAAKDAGKASASKAVSASSVVTVERVKSLTPSDTTKPAADSDPVADTIRQKSATPPVVQKTDAGKDDKWTYLLQTNAYRELTEAQNERARLALSGFESGISEATINGTKLYRVRLGPFPNVDAMSKMRSKLADSGINAAIVRIPK